MSCGCIKDGLDVNIDDLSKNVTKKDNSFKLSNIVKYSLKILGFLLVMALLPILNLIIIWLVFRTFVLNKEVDVRPALKFAAEKLRTKEKDDDEYMDEEINPDDYEMIEVEELNNA